MNIALSNMRVEVGDATFTFKDIGKDGAFKYFSDSLGLEERYEMMLDALVEVEGVYADGEALDAGRFKEANINVQAAGKILAAFSNALVGGVEDKKEKNAG